MANASILLIIMIIKQKQKYKTIK